ncbi:PAS domain S-box protein [Thioclava sp. FR2]|uniref:hybrid sensor histidine kinase/response regulator n=1 Tax=Thioclava sp. FR2 TaxID=3445780 RepID=UPI003EBB2939
MIQSGELFNAPSAELSLDDMRKRLAREVAALKEHRQLLKVFDHLVKQPNLDAALTRLVDLVTTQFHAQSVVIIAHDHGRKSMRLLASAGKLQVTETDFQVTNGYFLKARRLIDATSLGEKICGLGIQSAMLVPLDVPSLEAHSLICLAEAKEAFTHHDFKRLQAVAKISAQPLANLFHAQRTEKLASLINGNRGLHEDAPSASSLDLPFQVVSSAIGRLTNAQEMMVDVLNDILTASGADLDRRLADSLARICAHTGADRAQIGLVTPLGGLRHEISWTSPDCSRSAESDVVYWDKVVPSFMTQLSLGQPALLIRQHNDPTCVLSKFDSCESMALLPIMDGGVLIGVLTVDHTWDRYFFLPGMVYLLQSIANAIGSVYRQGRIEARTAEAQSSLWLEQMRLKATLSALPDLVIEVDETGRIITHHSQPNGFLAPFMDQIVGRTFEDALPDHLAALGRYMLQTVAETGRGECAPFQIDVGDGEVRWIKATAVSREGAGAEAKDTSVTLFVLRDVTTEVTQAEEISRLSQVARRTQNYVIMTDAERRVTWVNEAFEQATGWRLPEIRGRVPSDFLRHPSTDPSESVFVERELALGKTVQKEMKNITKDGREIWVSNDIQPIFDAAGQVSGYVGVQLDITQARESRVILLAALEALQDGFVIYDRDGKLVLCNEKYRRMYPGMEDVLVPGNTKDEIHDHALKINLLDNRQGMTREQLFDRMFGKPGEDRASEVRLTDGRWIRVVNKQTPDGYWVGLRVDITALKEAEAGAVLDRQAAMDAAQDGMARIKITGEVVYANKVFAEMFSMRDQLPIEGQHWATIMGPAVAEVVAKEAMPALKAGAPNWHGNVLLPPGSGKLTQIEISITPNRDGTHIWVVRDMSERLRDQEERMKLTEELQLAQRREVIGQLAAGLAHDFNNLLAAISGSALLIKEDQPRNSPDWDHAERILKSSAQAEAMVRRLLALGARPSHRNTTELGPVIHEAAEMLRPALSRSIKLDVQVADTRLLADVESTDILQIILNLGVNARDALLGRKTNTAKAELRLALRKATEDDLNDRGMEQRGSVDPELSYACLVLSDSGDGISEEAAKSVFASYYSTKGKNGTGLGLSIVTNMVRAAGGAISLHRSAMQGAEFRILLPLSTSDHTAPESKPAGPTLSEHQLDAAPSGVLAAKQTQQIHVDRAKSKPLSGVSILVVDDAESVLDVWTAVLERAGAAVAPTSEPEDAIEIFEEDPDAFDLVITDFDMGAISGADLTRTIKDLRPNLPVILITALTDWKSRDQAKASSNDPDFFKVLGKPVSTETLVGTALAAIDSTKD